MRYSSKISYLNFLIIFLVLSGTVRAGFLGDVLNNLSDNIGAIPKITPSPTKDQALQQYIQHAALTAGYTPHDGGRLMVVIGNMGNHSADFVDGSVVPIAREFDVEVLHLMNSGAQLIEFTQDNKSYSADISNSSVVCDSNLSSCKQVNLFQRTNPNKSAEEIGFIVANILFYMKPDPQTILSKIHSNLHSIAQIGMNGKNHLYIFFDPNCSTCSNDFNIIQSNLKSLKKLYPNVGIYWVPTDLFGQEKSTGMAEQALEGGFAAMSFNFTRFNQTGGLFGKSNSTRLNNVAYNIAAAYYFALTFGVNGRQLTLQNLNLPTPTLFTIMNGTLVGILGFPEIPKFFSAINTGGI